jgi:hypothetical protein
MFTIFSKPKDVPAKAHKWIGRYMAATKGKGIILKPDRNKGLLHLLEMIGTQKL